MNLVPAPPRDSPYQHAGILNFVFGHVWQRPGLNRRDRRFVTVACVGVCEAPIPISAHVGSALKSGDIIEARDGRAHPPASRPTAARQRGRAPGGSREDLGGTRDLGGRIVKPAPFDYHAPDDRRRGRRRCSPSTATRPRCSPAARASCRCSRCAWPASTTSSTSAASPSCAASSGATARVAIGAATHARRRSERDADGRRGRAAAGRGRRRSSATSRSATAARSAARSPTPTRRRSTRRSRSALDAEFEVRRRRRRRARVAAADFFTGTVDDRARARRAARRRRASRCGRARCGFAVEEFARRHGDFAIAGAVVGVELDGDDRSRAAPSRCSAWGRRRCGRRAPRRRSSGSRAERGRRRRRRPARASATRRRPDDVHGSAAYRDAHRRGPWSTRAWTRGARGGDAWLNDRGHRDGQRRAAHAPSVEAAQDARRLPPRGLRAHRHAPRLRARRVRRVHRAASTATRCARA